MKFLVDARLPARLAVLLNRTGHDATHTSSLANGNASTDAEIIEKADAEDRVVVTKHRDFRDRHLLAGRPGKLFILAAGNISNGTRMELFDAHLGAAESALGGAGFVELRAGLLVVHSRTGDGPGTG